MQKKFLLAILAVLSVTVIFYFGNGALSGFFGLGAANKKESTQQDLLGGDANKVVAGNENASMNAVLSFKVLKKSSIEAELEAGDFFDCPQTSDANILIKNSGSAPAEAIKITPGAGILVKACENCFVEKLEVGEEKTARLKLCRENEKTSIIVSAANANEIELKLNGR